MKAESDGVDTWKLMLIFFKYSDCLCLKKEHTETES